MDNKENNVDKITVLSCDGVEITGSKELLMKESEYFRALYRSGMKESRPTSGAKIPLSGLHSEGLRFVFRFVEGKECTNSFSMDLIYPILETASYLQITRVTEASIDFVRDSLNSNNFQTIREIAEDFMFKELSLFVYNYACDNFSEIIKGNSFLCIPLDFLTSLLNSDKINTKTELVLFRAGIKWIQAQDKLGDVTLDDILSGIRFALMLQHELDECRTCLRSMDVDSSLQIFKQIDLAEAHLKNPTLMLEQEEISSFYQARCTRPTLLAIGGFTQSNHSTNRLMILPTNDLTERQEVTWDCYHPCKDSLRLSTTLCEHCAVSVGPFIFVAGGQTKYCQDGRHTKKNVYRLDTRNGTWTEVSPMKTPRSLFYMGLLDGYIYAVGGWIEPNRVSKGVERYRPSKDEWQPVAQLEIGLHEHAGTEYGGKLYVSGGFKGPYRGHLDRVWVYSPALDRWEEKANMINARSYHAMVATDSHILVAGGVRFTHGDIFEDVMDCEQFNPESNDWTVITRIPLYANCMSSCLLQDSLYIFGGHSFALDADHHQIQIYNTNTGKWTYKEMHTQNAKFFVSVLAMLPRKIEKCFKKKQKNHRSQKH